jgi:hypothetical protein
MIGLRAKTLDFLDLDDDGLLHLYPLEGVVIELPYHSVSFDF